MNRPAIPNIAITGNPSIDMVLISAVASAVWSMVTWIAIKLNVEDPEFATNLFVLGVTVAAGLGTLAYTWVMSRINQAKSVQAGINLTVSGNALAADGETVVSANDGATPPKPVTAKTAAEIVKNFALP